MLNQNWFAAKNFVMFCDYTEYQLFYDTETKNIYEVSEGVMDRANTTIREFTPNNPEYYRLHCAYESFLDSSNNSRKKQEKKQKGCLANTMRLRIFITHLCRYHEHY